MDTTDTELALRCLGLAADLRRLQGLDPETRERVLADVGHLLELLFEVLLEPGPCFAGEDRDGK